MRSLFRDQKYPILVLFVFIVVIPVLGALTGYAFDFYAFVDATAYELVFFALTVMLLYHLPLWTTWYAIGIRCAVGNLTSKLQRRNGKRVPVLDLRDARILVTMAEATILSGDATYGIAVIDHVRGDRRDLYQNHAILRYEIARAMLILAMLGNDSEEARRQLGVLLREWKKLSPVRIEMRRAETDLFTACVRLMDDGGETEVAKLRAAARKDVGPMLEALALHVFVIHYEERKDYEKRDDFRRMLQVYSGDAAFMKGAGCRMTTLTYRAFSPERNVRGALVAMSGLLSLLLGIGLVVNMVQNLRHGGTFVVGWTVQAVIAVVLGAIAAKSAWKRFARAGLVLGVAALVFFASFSFSLADLRTSILLDPLKRAEAITGIDFMLEDGVMEVGSASNYEILMVTRVTVNYQGSFHDELVTELLDGTTFMSGSVLLNRLGDAVPDSIRNDFYVVPTYALFVNLTEGTMNVRPNEVGLDVVLFISYVPMYGELRYTKYIMA